MHALFDESQLPLNRVLIVDDSPIITESLRQCLEGHFEIDTADSGEACLERLGDTTHLPDLILLDIEMGGVDGYETCRRLRKDHDMPVVFVSSHDDLPERLKAFDSGGDDFVVKPFDPELMLRKAQRFTQLRAEKKALAAEKESLHSMAMGFLRDINDNGVLRDFMRASLALTNYDLLAEKLLEATRDYGVQCHVQVRHPGGAHTLTPKGNATPLEESVLERSATMGRIFQFGRRLVINYNHVSILILELPSDETDANVLRDSISILAGSAEAIADSISMGKEAVRRANALQSAIRTTADVINELRELYAKQQSDTRVRLQEMIDEVEKAYPSLVLTDRQEERISLILRRGAIKTSELFDLSAEFNKRFNQILDALRAQLPPPDDDQPR